MKLSIENLSVSIDGHRILEEVDLDIEQGAFCSLLGPSGCGKSTLLKAICGLLPCDSGRIRRDGADMTMLPARKRGLSIIFQDLRLFPHLDVAGNVGFPLKMQRADKTTIAARVDAALAQVQLQDHAHRKISELSGGQQQRVALARALVTEPDILLLDEPFSALDENLREDMRVLLLDLHQRLGMTVVFVTHNQEEALAMSTQVAVMNRGRILQVDSPETIYRRPATLNVARYFHDGNMLKGRVRDGLFESGKTAFEVRAQDCEGATALVRPEAIRFSERGIPCKVLRSEYQGGRTVYDVECGNASFKFPAPADTKARPGDNAKMEFAPEGTLVFDGDGRLASSKR